MIPRGARIGRNVKIAGDVKATDFASRVVKSGASVDSPRPVTAAARLAAANRPAAATRGGRRKHAGDRRRRPARPTADGRARPRARRDPRVRVDGPHRPSRVDCPPCLQRSRACSSGPPTSSAGSTTWASSRAPASRSRRRHVVGPPSRRPPPVRRAHHADPRPGVRPDLLGPFRAADRRRLPQVVPQAAPLERRVPVREVLAGRGRPAGPRDRARRPRPLDRDVLGLAIARSLAIADRLLEESAGWLWIGGRIPDTSGRTSRGAALIDRFADRLGELAGDGDAPRPTPGARRGRPPVAAEAEADDAEPAEIEAAIP